MTKRKTALMQATDDLQAISDHHCKAGNDLLASAYADALNVVKKLLPTEREEIEQAYEQGLMDGVGCPIKYKSKSDYFTSTFE